ncbi:hypothetical protein TGCAST_233830 [Toxoplasma gondii CAST]|uniref:THUMP domain-containing protein n=1 Tax=Toxoplasma gondii CAST TaxID=943122 RepID=A0A3R7ZEJ0_TOXGO|nr:hypothetical protein TGCAST_233830 [Toxoplasma gondii CAST]
MKRSGARGDGRGDGASFSEKRRRLNVEQRQGCKGVFLTTNTGDRHAIREFMNLMNQFLPEDDSRKPEMSTERGAADEVTDALASELATLREGQRRFIPMKDLLKGAIFIRFTREEDIPSEILHGLMERMVAQPGVFSCRHIARIIPVDATAPPTVAGLLSIVRPLIAKQMLHSRAARRSAADGDGREEDRGDAPAGSERTPKAAEGAASAGERNAVSTEAGESQGDAKGDETADPVKDVGGRPSEKRGKETEQGDNHEGEVVSTWSCQYTSRGFDTVKKQVVLDLLAEEVGSAYKVNIRESEFSIVVECNPIFFGASIVRDYGKFFRYNMHRCCHPEEGKESSSGQTPGEGPESSAPPTAETDASDAHAAAPETGGQCGVETGNK